MRQGRAATLKKKAIIVGFEGGLQELRHHFIQVAPPISKIKQVPSHILGKVGPQNWKH